MKKLFFIVAAVCLLTATSCVNNNKKSEPLRNSLLPLCRSMRQNMWKTF